MNVKNRYGNWDGLQRPLLVKDLTYTCTLYFIQHPTLVPELKRFEKSPPGSFGGSIDGCVMLLVPALVLDGPICHNSESSQPGSSNVCLRHFLGAD